MLRQYGAGRVQPSLPMRRVEKTRKGKTTVQYVPDPEDFNLKHRVGTVAIGTIVYLQDRIDRYSGPVFRNPWIVQAWKNREYHPAVKNKPHTTYMRGGHIAVVKSLRDGRMLEVSDYRILNSLEY